MTTHPDQHSIAIGGGSVYVGNDGGLYRRPLRGRVNANGHATDGRTSTPTSGRCSPTPSPWAWSLVASRCPADSRTTAARCCFPRICVGRRNDGIAVRRRRRRHAGRSGGRLSDPSGVRGLAMELTTNCGRSDGTVRWVRDIDPGDPNPRFIAPFEADTVNPDHWVAGGQSVWLNTRGLAIENRLAVDARVQQWRRPFDNGRRQLERRRVDGMV